MGQYWNLQEIGFMIFTIVLRQNLGFYRLNATRQKATSMSVQQLYEMCFDAHYNLVTIHPWADGNGRMARLLMNWLQFEFGLIPSRIFSDDKEEYIKALVATREDGNLSIFRNFMTKTMVTHLMHDIEAYEKTIEEETIALGANTLYAPKKTRDKIIELLRQNPKLSAISLAIETGISAKGIYRHLAKLKAEGVLRRIGPDKGGEWQVID